MDERSMSREYMQRVVQENYPANFLEQFGGLLKQVVGLEEPKSDSFLTNSTSTHVCVNVLSKLGSFLGTYFIEIGVGGSKQVKHLSYQGSHPLIEQTGGGVHYNPLQRIREDDFRGIIFPGIAEQKN